MEDKTKNHFENEAIEYDNVIIKLIPYYTEMVQAIVATIPFQSNEEIRVIDLGSGTGSLSQAIQQQYPQAKLTLVDVAENMLQIAEQKLGGNCTYVNSDFNSFDFDKQYDVIVSSLALHHIEKASDKQLFYSKIYKALKPGGVFVNGDIVKAQTDKLQTTFVEKWIAYMNRSIDMKEINEKLLPGYYAEDRPIPFMNHLEMLRVAGFKDIDVVWKYYGYSVYKGGK